MDQAVISAVSGGKLWVLCVPETQSLHCSEGVLVKIAVAVTKHSDPKDAGEERVLSYTSVV